MTKTIINENNNEILVKKISKFDNFFKITERNSTIKKEIIGGVSTFFAMVYILFVNPSILEISSPIANSTGALFLGTTIITFLGTLLLGLFANVPLVQAPGMGINAFFTFTVCNLFKLGYGEALICVMISGILYTIITITPLRKMITESVPKNFKIAISVMIGLFIAYVGLTSSGIVTSGVGTPTEIFKNFENSATIGILIISLLAIFVGITLHFCKIKFSILITIGITVAMLLISGGIDYTNIGSKIFILRNYNEFANFDDLSMNMFNSFKIVFTNPLSYVAIFCFLYVNFFDTTSVLTWARNDEGFEITNLNDKNKKIDWMNKAYISNAIITTLGSFCLTSNLTTYVESASGVKSGARTGFSSIIVATLILLCIPAYPILNPLLPIDFGNNITLQPISGPISVLIGSMIISELRHFDWKEFSDIPVLLFIIVFGFLGYSISLGIAFGSITYILINGINGIVNAIKFSKNDEYNKLTLKERYSKSCKISLIMWIICLLSTIYLILEILIKTKIIIS